MKNMMITVVADTYYEYQIDELDIVIRNYKGTDAAIYVNDIIMPYYETDTTFFFASVQAALNDKVWIEEAHTFMPKSFKAQFEAGCFDIEDLDKEYEGGWNAFVLENIYTDIMAYNSVTCDGVGSELGLARVYDKDVADLCRDNGWGVLHEVDNDKTDEYGQPLEYWMVFHDITEDEDTLSKEDEDILWEEDEDEKILDITATASVIKPIAKSIYRAWAKGLIEWEGFTVCPLFNMTKVYNLMLYKGKHGYSMYVTPLNENTDWKEFLIDFKEEGAITPEDEGYIIDEDNYWVDEDSYRIGKDMRAEKLSVDKDRSKGRSNNSRRSKGIHKDRKNYKKLKNRRSRHQSKKALKNYNMKIDFEGVEHYFEDIYGYGWSVYVRDSLTQGWIYESYFNEYRAKGVEVDLEYFEEDEDGYYWFDRTLDFLSVSELIKLGFAE